MGSTINNDGSWEKGICKRISTAKNAMNMLTSIWKDRSLRKGIKISLVTTLVLYGSETWTIGTRECWNIDAFEIWRWRRRRMLHILWTVHHLNSICLKWTKNKTRLFWCVFNAFCKWLAVRQSQVTHSISKYSMKKDPRSVTDNLIGSNSAIYKRLNFRIL